MGRKSVAQYILDGIEDEDDETLWIVCYDFQRFINLRRFYPNRDRIISKLGGVMLQYSVFIGNRSASLAIYELVRKYDGEATRLELKPDQPDFDQTLGRFFSHPNTISS